MASNITMEKNNKYCDKCKGACWDDDQSKRQENSYKMFGVIPNKCVDSEIDGPKCPYYKP